MTETIEIPSLESLEEFKYINTNGVIKEDLQGKVGVYAIFDEARTLQYVGYSRDIYLSLKQHLVRCVSQCYWLKVYTISRPSRTILEEIRQAWLAGKVINSDSQWVEPIDVRGEMTSDEIRQYEQETEMERIKILRNVARRVEASILEVLKKRGVIMDLRFNPKLKEQGLLDLK